MHGHEEVLTAFVQIADELEAADYWRLLGSTYGIVPISLSRARYGIACFAAIRINAKP